MEGALSWKHYFSYSLVLCLGLEPHSISFPCQDVYCSSELGLEPSEIPVPCCTSVDVLFVRVLLWQPQSRDLVSVASLTLLGDISQPASCPLALYHLFTRCSLSLGSRNCVAQVSGGVGHPGSLVLCILTIVLFSNGLLQRKVSLKKGES